MKIRNGAAIVAIGKSHKMTSAWEDAIFVRCVYYVIMCNNYNVQQLC